MEDCTDKNSNKVSFSKMSSSMIQKKLLIKEEHTDFPMKQIKTFLEEESLTRERLPRQIFDLIVDSLPNVATMLGVFYYNFINMLFVRQFNDSLILASFGMGVTWYSSTCLCVLISLGNGLFIQLAQAYGVKNFKLMSELYQRSQAIEMAIGMISSLALYNTYNILTFLGISEDVSSLTQQFSVACIPSVFGTVLYDTTRQLLIAQNNFAIPMKIQLLVYFIHPLWCFTFTSIFDLGIMGIGIARGLSEYTGYFLLCYIIKQRKLCDEVWSIPYNFTLMFQQWIPFLKISIPVGCLVFLEWIFFEIQTIIVARLNDDKILAGQTAFQSIVMFFYMVPLGLSMTTNSYLGNAVGEGRKKVCQNFSKITMIACLIEVICFLFVGECLKNFFTSLFVTDAEMEVYFRYAYNMYLYTFLFGDYFQVILNGILRCCNQQNYAAYSTFIVYYIFGLPLTYLLTFNCGLGLGGVWLTQSIASTTVSIIFYLRIRLIDWDDSIKVVQNRVKEENYAKDYELNKLSHIEVQTPSCSPMKHSTV